MTRTARIPSATGHFSMFVDGVVTEITNYEKESFVNFNDLYVFSVYYKIHGYRTVYLCISPSVCPQKYQYKLSNVEGKVCVVSRLEGRAFDRYKRCCRMIFQLCPKAKGLDFTFYWQLAELCRSGRNSKFNILLLLKKYNLEIRWRKYKSEKI